MPCEQIIRSRTPVHLVGVDLDKMENTLLVYSFIDLSRTKTTRKIRARRTVYRVLYYWTSFLPLLLRSINVPFE